MKANYIRRQPLKWLNRPAVFVVGGYS